MDTSQQAWAVRTLRRAADSVRAAHPQTALTEHLVRSDSVVGALAEAAADAELTVLGSRGLGGLAGFVLGSVSQRVVARSPRPVVLVRAGVTSSGAHLPAADGISPEEIPDTPYRDVVLGLDTRHPCDELIAFAFESAARRRRGATPHAVHAFGAPAWHLADGPGQRCPRRRCSRSRNTPSSPRCARGARSTRRFRSSRPWSRAGSPRNWCARRAVRPWPSWAGGTVAPTRAPTSDR
jgi:hypothetical protein